MEVIVGIRVRLRSVVWGRGSLKGIRGVIGRGIVGLLVEGSVVGRVCADVRLVRFYLCALILWIWLGGCHM